METANNLAYESDDSIDLPDLSELTSEQPTEFKEGTIVWAKYRKFYWPSLIRKVFKKDRKVSLWYLDSPKKCFKVSFKNIHSFTDRSFSQNVRREVNESPMKDLHEKVLDLTLTYIQRKGEGIKDDPGAYFDRSMHYLSLYELKSNKANNARALPNIEFLRSNLHNNYDDSSDEESVTDSEEEDEKYDKFKEALVMEDEEYCPEDKAEAIVAYIKAGKLNKYLLGVASHKIPSRRQMVFDEYIRTRDVDLLMENSMKVHIKDINKDLEILNYLQNYYESVIEKGKWNMFKYVTSVWLPDALDEALSAIESAAKDTSETLSAKDTSETVTLSLRRQLFSSDEDEGSNQEMIRKSPRKGKLRNPNENLKSPRKQSMDKETIRKSPRKGTPGSPDEVLKSPINQSMDKETIRKSPRKGTSGSPDENLKIPRKQSMDKETIRNSPRKGTPGSPDENHKIPRKQSMDKETIRKSPRKGTPGSPDENLKSPRKQSMNKETIRKSPRKGTPGSPDENFKSPRKQSMDKAKLKVNLFAEDSNIKISNGVDTSFENGISSTDDKNVVPKPIQNHKGSSKRKASSKKVTKKSLDKCQLSKDGDANNNSEAITPVLKKMKLPQKTPDVAPSDRSLREHPFVWYA